MQVDSPTVDYLPAFNLGGAVNGPAEDIDVFVGSQNEDSSAVIYFASDRAGGEGGMDIYRAEKTMGTWSTPTNIGTPVNASSNEIAPYIPPIHDRIFFSSDRDAGAGAGVDLYEALNTLPRPRVLWGADDQGSAGDTVTVELAVYNIGNFPFLATPTATRIIGKLPTVPPRP